MVIEHGTICEFEDALGPVVVEVAVEVEVLVVLVLLPFLGDLPFNPLMVF